MLEQRYLLTESQLKEILGENKREDLFAKPVPRWANAFALVSEGDWELAIENQLVEYRFFD